MDLELKQLPSLIPMHSNIEWKRWKVLTDGDHKLVTQLLDPNPYIQLQAHYHLLSSIVSGETEIHEDYNVPYPFVFSRKTGRFTKPEGVLTNSLTRAKHHMACVIAIELWNALITAEQLNIEYILKLSAQLLRVLLIVSFQSKESIEGKNVKKIFNQSHVIIAKLIIWGLIYNHIYYTKLESTDTDITEETCQQALTTLQSMLDFSKKNDIKLGWQRLLEQKLRLHLCLWVGMYVSKKKDYLNTGKEFPVSVSMLCNGWRYECVNALREYEKHGMLPFRARQELVEQGQVLNFAINTTANAYVKNVMADMFKPEGYTFKECSFIAKIEKDKDMQHVLTYLLSPG